MGKSADSSEYSFTATFPLPRPFEPDSFWAGVVQWRIGDGPWHEVEQQPKSD